MLWGLIAGAVIYHTLFPRKPGPKILMAAPLPKPLFWVTLAAAGLGVALRIVDRFVLRGVTLGDDFASVRAQLESNSAHAAFSCQRRNIPRLLQDLIFLLLSAEG